MDHKAKKIAGRRLVALAVMVAAWLMPLMGQAKFTKACSYLERGPISAKVIDRHEFVGAAFDTYGYTVFKNSSQTDPVKVDWIIYGVLNKGGRLVRLDEGTFTMAPRSERNEVYNYGAGKFTHRDFKTYVVAIDISILADPESSKPITDNGYSMDDDELYDSVSRLVKEGRPFSQSDYRAMIKWLQTIVVYEFGDPTNVGSVDIDVATVKRKQSELVGQWLFVADQVLQAHRQDKFDTGNEELYDDFNGYYVNMYGMEFPAFANQFR